MEQLIRNEDTPAGKIATERLISATLDPDRYPDGIAFVAADAPDFERMLADSFTERRPVAIVYPDGREVVATPGIGPLSQLVEWFRRTVTIPGVARNMRSVSVSPRAIAVPSHYRVEIRRAKLV
jgi:hypothetical protein